VSGDQTEAARFDLLMASFMNTETREGVWSAVDNILSHGPLADSGSNGATGLALGYVQSGKTTNITALLALAADQGYRVIIALLGSTNLLLDQNTGRIEDAITGGRRDYRWIAVKNAKGVRTAKTIDDWIQKDRIVLLPLLKHAGRITDLLNVIAGSAASDLPVLIVDDEADQASLNTATSKTETSKTYKALTDLRDSLPHHLYVQYTATPYAPLLLDLDDELKPEFVTLLHPGPGYTGGREFFVDHADTVIRSIPAQDEQATKSLPLRLPGSLETALANFLMGSAMLLALPEPVAPVSMLIHSTQRNDVQARYQFLVERKVRKWAQEIGDSPTLDGIPHIFRDEMNALVWAGAVAPEASILHDSLKRTLREAMTWLVNSESALKSIEWNVTPVHILVGGNKLDRGFTVEGLTVTYMNRPASAQIDTLEQRARAFGYRAKLLPYCQFFATPRTLKVLRDIVFTEYDLRAKLRDMLDSGGTVHEWATEVGLLLPSGTKPTRSNVIGSLQAFNAAGSTWFSLRRPSLVSEDVQFNAALVEALEIAKAERRDFGRLSFPTIEVRASYLIDEVLEPWRLASYSPGWRPQEIIDHLRRGTDQDTLITVTLMDDQLGGPRTRSWDELGFVNLFQGRDTRRAEGQGFYPGDRDVPFDADDDRPALQIHLVSPRHTSNSPLYTLAVKLGDRQVVRKVPAL
jgi:hypothetical protein